MKSGEPAETNSLLSINKKKRFFFLSTGDIDSWIKNGIRVIDNDIKRQIVRSAVVGYIKFHPAQRKPPKTCTAIIAVRKAGVIRLFS